MKTKQLFEKLVENWPVKAVCFVMAIFLYIFNQQSGMTTKIIKTKVSVRNENGFRPADVFNPDVSVSVRGGKDSVNSLSESNFQAYLDFSYIPKDGEYDLPVLLKVDEVASMINPLEVKVVPEKIKVKVEEEISGFAKIEPLLKGEAQHGYEVESVSIEPEQVKISGARSLVENCKSLQTENIVLSNAKTSFSGKAKIVNPKKNISLETDEISFTVKIVESESSKSLGNIRITADNLSSNLEIQNMEISVQVSVVGSVLSLERFTGFSNVCHADLSALTESGTFDVPLRYYLPVGVRLSDGYPKTISVTVAKKEEMPSQENQNADDTIERIDE